MAGTINFAMTQQFDSDGEPLSGGLLYFFEASTTNPQSAFQDIALTIAHPNPIILDASGRVPMFYLEDGNIKIRLTDENGVTVIAADNLLVIGPSSGSSGGAGVDPNTVLQVGDIKARFGTGTHDGFVPCNGRTIGAALSGASERANADCQELFEYLWSTTVLSVEPVRGVSANGDWLANARITLPDLRGRTIAGMDDMGWTAAARLTSTYFGASAITLGNVGGNEKHTLTAAELAAHTHSSSGSLTTGLENQGITVSVSGTTVGSAASGYSLDHTHTLTNFQTLGGISGGGSAIGFAGGVTITSGASFGSGDHAHNFSGTGAVTSNHNHNYSFTTNAGNGVSGSAFAVANPAMVLTFYIKL